jgi:hypothetical protein
MQTTWIISANAGRARFFEESNPAEPLQEIEDMVNTAVRLRVLETESDKIGPTAAAGSGHNIGGHRPTTPAAVVGVGRPGSTHSHC